MKSHLPLIVSAFMILVAFAISGCESSHQTDPNADGGGYTAGGNGAFGEDPVQPGAYAPPQQ